MAIVKSVYIIVPLLEAQNNWAMLNSSTSSSFDNVRKSLDGTKFLFEASLPVKDVFLSYRWYTIEEIRDILENGAW